MIRGIALALAVAAITTSVAAQSTRKLTWDDYLKPYEAKTDPTVPIAPPQPIATPDQSLKARQLSWMDECVIGAVAQGPLPVAPWALRQIMDYCAAQSIWIGK